ncbi:MAG: hypothetical protein INR65_15390, partial [Gluconacetobacter diazotrophicus]|nr:hypothetical protein [Gluconacetobacter diazotrophicus]
VEKPPGAAVVLDSAFTPFAGLDYGDAVSFQFHPEFEANYARALIEARRERYGTEAADTAAASYAGAEERGADRMRVARWIGRFLEQAMDGERRRQNNHPS